MVTIESELRANASPVGARLVIALPALNEAATIQTVIANIPRRISGIATVDVLVVDDGSTDDTAELARAVGATVVSHTVNRGVGAAIQTALAEASRRGADVLVNMDADGQFDASYIEALVRPILEGRADMVTASRFKDPARVPQMPKVKLWGNRGMSRLVSYIVGQRFHDVSCGFRAYSTEAMRRLVLTGSFTYTQESFLVLATKGLKIVEVPVPVRGTREHGKSRVASNLWRYAWLTSSIIFGSVRDYRPNVFFNTSAALLLLLALAFATFFIAHRMVAGQFTPHIWAGFVSAFFAALAGLVFSLGQVAGMISTLRAIQDEQMYVLKRIEAELDRRRNEA